MNNWGGFTCEPIKSSDHVVVAGDRAASSKQGSEDMPVWPVSNDPRITEMLHNIEKIKIELDELEGAVRLLASSAKD